MERSNGCLRGATLHKVHGCITQPQDAVLTKDDYRLPRDHNQ